MNDDITRTNITKWAWYTGSFLIIANRLNQENPASTTNLFEAFHQTHPEFPQGYRFNPVNPGMVMMLLYGILVVSKETWDARNDFPFLSRQRFTFKVGNPEISSKDFIRLLRNAVAHAHFTVNVNSQEYTFWNVAKDGQRDFEVTVSQSTLGDFLTELGRFYINYVSNQ